MSRQFIIVLGIVVAAISQAVPCGAVPGPADFEREVDHADPGALIAAVRDSMKALAFLDGVWRGPASNTPPSGDKRELMQTERIGPMLDGAVRVIEGRGYGPDGSLQFNALGIISYDMERRAYAMHSYAQGRAGDFPLLLRPDGYAWQIPMGAAMVRYTVEIKDGTWHEVGDRIESGKAPARFFEMNLKRVGDTDWPAAGAVPAH